MEIYNDTYCVYMHINKINEKKYVGQTKYGDDPNKRWRNGLGYELSSYFYHAIQKYGWDNFEHEVIASNLTQEEANHFEELLIEKLETTNPDKGYNLKSGGENHIRSESSILKQISSMQNTIRRRHKEQSFEKYQERFNNGDPAIRKCSQCGALFEIKLKWNKSHTKKIPYSNKIKRCEDCRKRAPAQNKVIVCIDCGIDVVINPLATAICRCEKCQTEHNKLINRERQKRWYNKNVK